MITEAEYLALPTAARHSFLGECLSWWWHNNLRFWANGQGIESKTIISQHNLDNWQTTGAIIEWMQELGYKFEINSIRGVIAIYDAFFCTADEGKYWNAENNSPHFAVQIAALKALGVMV